MKDLQASEQEKVCLSSSLAQLQGEKDALERTVKPLQLTVDELQSKVIEEHMHTLIKVTLLQLEVALNQNTAMDAGKSVDDNATLETLLGMKEENLQLRSKAFYSSLPPSSLLFLYHSFVALLRMMSWRGAWGQQGSTWSYCRPAC